MTEQEAQPQQPMTPPAQGGKVQPQPTATNLQTPASALKPNKNVVVPKYDLITEGYDPDKLKGR
jgi:hypothetical protein